MRTLASWFSEYDRSHRHLLNKWIHKFAVPLIMFSTLGLLWSIPRPEAFVQLNPYVNWASIVAVPCLIFYAILSFKIFAGMTVIVLLHLYLLQLIDASTATPLWQISLVIFVAAWIVQFIGHQIEGKRPSFFKDLAFLLIGPAWVLAFVYRTLGVKI